MGELVKLKESNVDKVLAHLKSNLTDESKVFIFYENPGDGGYSVSCLGFSPPEIVFAFETFKLSILVEGL